MIHLVKHFLLRGRPRIALLVSLIPVAYFLSIWHFLSSELEPARFMPLAKFVAFMFVALCGIFMMQWNLGADEFDLILPVRRKTLYLAKNLAAFLLMVIVAAPVSAVILSLAAFQGSLREAFQSLATAAPFWTAMFLTAAPLLQLGKWTWPPLAVLMGAGTPILLFVLQMKALEERISSLLPVGVAVPAAALAWFLGRWQFERYELVPGHDAGPARVTADRSGILDPLSPMVRVLAHAVWLQWRYPLLIVGMVIIGFISIPKNSSHIWFYPIFGNAIIVSLSRNIEALQPFVSRRTILRSVLGPVMAAPMFIGGVLAVTSGSAQMIVRGLALALVIVGMTWLMLPSAKEYCRPFLVRVRCNLWWILFISIAGCTFIPGVEDLFRQPLSEAWPGVASLVAGKPVLVSCVIVLAIALLWWRCQRKFRYFEPFDLPSGFTRTA